MLLMCEKWPCALKCNCFSCFYFHSHMVRRLGKFCDVQEVLNCLLQLLLGVVTLRASADGNLFFVSPENMVEAFLP